MPDALNTLLGVRRQQLDTVRQALTEAARARDQGVQRAEIRRAGDRAGGPAGKRHVVRRRPGGGVCRLVAAGPRGCRSGAPGARGRGVRSRPPARGVAGVPHGAGNGRSAAVGAACPGGGGRGPADRGGAGRSGRAPGAAVIDAVRRDARRLRLSGQPVASPSRTGAWRAPGQRPIHRARRERQRGSVGEGRLFAPAPEIRANTGTPGAYDRPSLQPRRRHLSRLDAAHGNVQGPPGDTA